MHNHILMLNRTFIISELMLVTVATCCKHFSQSQSR